MKTLSTHVLVCSGYHNKNTIHWGAYPTNSFLTVPQAGTFMARAPADLESGEGLLPGS